MALKRVVARWKEEPFARLAADLARRLYRGVVLSPASLPMHHARGDLRGLALPAGRIEGVTFEAVDFSASSWSGVWLEACAFHGCSFDDAGFDKLSEHSNSFADCTFDRASFTGAGIGYRRSKYARCHFSRTDFRRAIFATPEIDDCVFSDCRLDGVDFFGASFERCRFVGTVKSCWFRGTLPAPDDVAQFGEPRPNEMRDVDFSDAALREVTFSDGCYLGSCRLPARGRVRRFARWLSVLSKALASLEQWTARLDTSVAGSFIESYLVHVVKQDWYIVNFDDIAGEVSEPFARAFESLLINSAGALA